MITPKRILSTLALTTFGAAAAQAGMATAIQSNSALQNGLVAFYGFDSSSTTTATNSAGSLGSNYSGGFVDGTISGTGVSSGFSGNSAYNSTGGATNVSNRSSLIDGNAANFAHTSSSTNFINTGIGISQLGSSFSIGMAFYAAPDADSTGTTQRYYLYEGQNNYNVSLGTTNSSATTSTWNYTGYANQSPASATPAITTNAWHYQVTTFTFDGINTTMNIFIDGATTASITKSITGTISDFGSLYIGNARSGQTRDWDGLIDDVTLYNRALTSSDITALYNASAVPEPSTYGLIGAGALASVAFVRRRRKA